MQQNLPYKSEEKIVLPVINLLDKTELAFSHAFLQTAHTLYSYLQNLHSTIASVSDSTTEPYTIAILGLFSKMIRSYYSYVLLEIHHDRVGSQFLIEHLSEAAITIAYLLETANQDIFADYASVSIDQAQVLLQEVESQLQHIPNNLDLLVLRERLKLFITEQTTLATEREFVTLAVDEWEVETADTTAKRAASMGLSFLSNPARQVAQKVAPASLLDIRLNYYKPAANNLQSESSSIDFQQLRDASHLCLHATRALLEEFVKSLTEKSSEIQQQQQDLSRFFEWFYQAYQAYSHNSDASLKSN